MAGRNHLPPPNALKIREVSSTRAPYPSHHNHHALIEEDRYRHRSGPIPVSAGRYHPAVIDERIVIQHREIQTLLGDNQRLAATHVALKQELAAAQQEISHLSAAAASVKAERDAQVREVYERSLKMEAEVRSIDALNAELAQVRADVQKLSASRQELAAQLQTINTNLSVSRSELKEVQAVKDGIENMRKELQRGRAAIEYEKKTHSNNLEQSEAMGKNMMAMAHEVEKLRAELANAEKRARAAAAAAAAANPSPVVHAYAASYGNSDMGYGGSFYHDPYAMHQAHGGPDAGPQYGAGAVPLDPYDMQRPHAHR